MSVKPRPGLQDFIQLPKGQKILYVQAYRTLHTKYPKWKFWRNEKVKYNLAIVSSGNKVYLVDPDAQTVELHKEKK